MNFIPGSSEPKLQPIAPALAGWLKVLRETADPGRIRRDIEALPAPRSRLHFPEAMEAADAYILDVFREQGWEAGRLPFEFEGARGFLDYGVPENFSRLTVFDRLQGANIVAEKRGLESNEAVVILGHHDTIRDSPGANDNTASVAALLEIARLLGPHRFKRSVVLATTDMEEIGFFGARALASRLASERRTLGVINFETMAYTSPEPGSQMLPPGINLIYADQVKRMKQREMRGDFTAVIYNGPAKEMAKRFAEGLAETAGPQTAVLLRDPNDLPAIGKALGALVPAVRNFARSDHVPFWQAGIPAFMVTDTADFRYGHYHRPTDTVEKLDLERVASIALAACYAAARFAGLEP